MDAWIFELLSVLAQCLQFVGSVAATWKFYKNIDKKVSNILKCPDLDGGEAGKEINVIEEASPEQRKEAYEEVYYYMISFVYITVGFIINIITGSVKWTGGCCCKIMLSLILIIVLYAVENRIVSSYVHRKERKYKKCTNDMGKE